MRLIYLSLIYVVSLGLSAQPYVEVNKKNEDKELIRTSAIRSKTVWEYIYVPGNEHAFRDSGFKALNYDYDEFGRVTQYTKYHIYAPLTVREMYTYNKAGKISNTTRINSNGDVIEVIDYKYTASQYLKKEIHSAYYNSVRVGVYFTITANVNESDIFSKLQEDLQIEPKLESYMITVNITDPEELNQYVVIGDESEPTAMRFSWGQLSQESQKGLLSYDGPNRKENTYKSRYVSEVAFRYDRNGNIKGREVYNTANDVIGRESFSYGSGNRRTNYYKYDDNGRISTIENYIYDAGGMLSESIGMDASGKMVGKITYKYAPDGRLEEKNWINLAGTINGKYKYVYDNNGRLLEETKFRGENEKENRLEYHYDDNGNILEIIRYDADNNREKLWKYIYEKYN